MEGTTMTGVLTPEEIEMLLRETTGTVKENPPQFTDADTDSGGVLFDKLKNQILRYPVVKKDTSYTIPAGVTSIGEEAFLFCKNLSGITVEKQNPINLLGEYNK
jgi:hypothetical protein